MLWGMSAGAMADDASEVFRLYTDLAWLWPLWGEASTEYAAYDLEVARLIQQYARPSAVTLLNVGCGGGKNVLNLKQTFEVTGLDRSPQMLAQARALNPECAFVEADMRSFQLGRTFDAVLMDDAISHMHTRADFEAAIRMAYAHLRPGGVMVVTPDVTRETFEQNRTTTTAVARDGIDVVFVENVYDPDPDDEQYEATVVYLIREQRRLRVETDHWRLGLFSINTWREILRDTGFELHEEPYFEGEDRYTLFACVKPADESA
jgi:SAM-dependent methyltransferase